MKKQKFIIEVEFEPGVHQAREQLEDYLAHGAAKAFAHFGDDVGIDSIGVVSFRVMPDEK